MLFSATSRTPGSCEKMLPDCPTLAESDRLLDHVEVYLRLVRKLAAQEVLRGKVLRRIRT